VGALTVRGWYSICRGAVHSLPPREGGSPGQSKREPSREVDEPVDEKSALKWERKKHNK